MYSVLMWVIIHDSFARGNDEYCQGVDKPDEGIGVCARSVVS